MDEITILEKEDKIILTIYYSLNKVPYANKIRETVFEHIDASDKDVAIDLSEISYLNSTDLSFILAVYKHLQKTGRNLSICAINEPTRKIMKLCAIDGLIPFPE